MQWLRRNFITGFFVTVPLFVSVVALVWIFRVVDGILGPWFAYWLGRDVPGLGVIATGAGILLVGAVASNVLGKRLLQRADAFLMKVPVFSTVYAPVKQLVAAFSPDNEFGFKRVVLAEIEDRGLVLGFLTREFTLDRGAGPERFVAIYVPTNHLYLGDVHVFPIERVAFPEMTVEQAIRVFLTGGMAFGQRLRADAPTEPRLGSAMHS